MWKVNNDGENNDRRRTFFSDKPFKFGSGELLIIKATDAIRAVTGPNMQKISDSNVSKQIWVIYIYTQSNYKLFMLFHSGDNLPYEVWDTTLCLFCVNVLNWLNAWSEFVGWNVVTSYLRNEVSDIRLYM